MMFISKVFFNLHNPEVNCNRIKIVTLKKPLLLAGGIMLFSCAALHNARHEKIQDTTICALVLDTLHYFNAFGSISLSVKGEKFKGNIAVLLSDTTGFDCTIYSPFAQIVAVISSKNDSAVCSAGDKTTRIGIHDSIGSLQFFFQYPFTFYDVVRILTGRTTNKTFCSLQPDSIYSVRRKEVFRWIKDSVTIDIYFSKYGQKIERVNYINKKGRFWELTLSSMKNGISKVIYFHDSEMNYFSIKYDRISFQ
jgi:hypothetical protein